MQLGITRLPLDGELDRMLNFFRPFTPVNHQAYLPAVDVREDADGLALVADLPGFKPEDIHIGLENGVLTVAGERREPTFEKAPTFHRLERRYGSFERRFTLPADVDGDKVEASFDAGVLTVRLPKRPEAKPKRIEIKTK